MDHYRHQSTDMIVSNAKKILGLEYKVIGYGVFRVVFDLNNGYVLKVAIRRQGLDCNATEVHLYRNCSQDLRKHLCPVKAFGHGWMIMEKMSQQVPDDLDHRKKISALIKEFRENGIRPGDLNPENLALSNDGDIIIIDYGHFNRNV
ncbi:hypothetical protein WQ54_04770 [Bacillus sp. SA1-12]|nr:hypothetical protein WQ54_04770 [Bacillus sp. SA1-12]